MLMARGAAPDEAQKLHRKWLKHRAFMVELACNKEWLAKIELEGQQLIQEQPELAVVVQQKLEQMRRCWLELETTTRTRARQLFEHKAQLDVGGWRQLDQQLSHLEQQPPQLEHSQYLPPSSQQPHRARVVEPHVGDPYHDVGQLGVMPESRAGAAECEEPEARAETRMVRLIQPLKERRRILLASKEMHQVAQDLEDEMLWIQERLPLASGKDYASSFHSAQQQAKAQQKLQRELAGRRARLAEVLERAGMIASLRTPEVEFVRQGAEHVRQLWEALQAETERRGAALDAALQAQQYYAQAAEAESWLAEQKLQLAVDYRGLDEASTLQLLKEQQAVEQAVEAYAQVVGLLSQQCQRLLEVGHPESEQMVKQQSHIERLYLSVKDVVEQRKSTLEQQHWLQQLHQDVEELEKWISQRELVAASTELGQDLEHVTVLQETFGRFVGETSSLGRSRLQQLNALADDMIKCGHADAAAIAEWKDGLNESWADLLELMETRTQMLAASQQLQRFFADCKEVLVQIAGKMQQLPELRCCQPSGSCSSCSGSSGSSGAAALQRARMAFEHSLQLLVAQVRQLQENASQLRTIYAGEKAEAILGQEQEVLEAWRQLLGCCEASHLQLTSITDRVQFFSVVRENLMWMEGIMGQIRWDEPRDLTTLETMARQHQELKDKMDARSHTIQQCADLGRILMAVGDSASEEVREKLDGLLLKQAELLEKWAKQERALQQKQEGLQLAQEEVRPEVQPGEAQGQRDEVEQLILRHQAFRKAAVTWKERFSALRQLSATEKKQEEVSATSWSGQRRLPLSCLSARAPPATAAASPLFLRPAAQARGGSLGATCASQRPCSPPAIYNPAFPAAEAGSGHAGRNQEADADALSCLTNSPPRDAGLGSLGRLQNHLADGRLQAWDSGAAAGPGFLRPHNAPALASLPQPPSSRGPGDAEQWSGTADACGAAQHLSLAQCSYLGQSPPTAGRGPSSPLLHSRCSAALAQAGGLLEPRAVRPRLAPPLPGGQHCEAAGPASGRGPETGLELLHSRLQRDPRGSRSDPQMDHLRQEREYRLGRQTSSEQEIQARLNELPMMVRQERYRRHLERQSSSEREGGSGQRLQRQDSSELEASAHTGSDKHTGEKRTTMAEIVEQVQEREAAHTRGETYRPSSSLSAPLTRFDGRPRARDRPKPRRRPRPKEPQEARRSRSAPATGAPTTPQPPSHTAQNESFLYRKKVTASDLEGQQRSPNSKPWVNVYCVLKDGTLTFYKDARNHNSTYNEEPPVALSSCSFDPAMGYKKKKNVFMLQTDDGNFFAFHAKDEEELKAWTSNISLCIAESQALKKWDKPDVSSADPQVSERKEKSEGDADARSERSEKMDSSEMADRLEGGAAESSASLKSK